MAQDALREVGWNEYRVWLADWKIVSEGFNVSFKVSKFISVHIFTCVHIFVKVNGYLDIQLKILLISWVVKEYPHNGMTRSLFV
jgi:hypothetical protein